MFLALKNGLGRLAVFFRGLLDEYGGAAAAYSLRRLGSAYSGPLVRVRRDSDDAELDFTSTTSIADWVNGKLETTLPADVATSSAAYSLRKVKDTYTGNAVRIRRSSDDVEVNVAFDANDEVSSSSLIEQAELGLNRAGVILFDGVDDDIDVNSALLPTSDFTLTIRAFVTSYPSSDATIFGQGTVVGTGRTVLQIQTDGQAFVFLNGVGAFTTANTFNLNEINTIVFSRSGDDYSLTLNGGTAVTNNSSGSPEQVNSQIGDAYSGANFEGSIQSLTVGSVSWDGKQSSAESLGWTVNGSPALSVVVPTTLGGFLTESINIYTQTSDLSVLAGSGTQYNFPSNVAANTIGQTYEITFEAKRNSGGSGTHGDVRLRTPSAWNYTVVSISDNLTAETNRFRLNTSSESYQTYTVTVTTNSGSSESPLRIQTFDTDDDYTVRNAVFNVVGHIAHVQTWYDQSANSNHATQNTSGDQPKIAEAGALLADGIDFDGVDDFFTASGVSTTQPYSVFMKIKASETGAVQQIFDSTSVDPAFFQFSTAGVLSINNPTSTVTSLDLTSTPTDVLISGFIDDPKTAFANGASILSPASGTGTNSLSGLTIGKHRNLSSNYYSGTFSELVIYDSDQSTNRFKIESNINNYYGIYTASHNGFVENWYDQSGNGNDATQTVNDDQPKIVSNGSYLGELDFDGSDDELTATSFSASQPITSFSVFSQDSVGSSIYGSGGSHQLITSTSNKIALNAGTALISSASITLGETTLVSALADSTSSFVYIDGGNATTGDAGTTGITSPLRLGNIQSGRYMDGTLKEVIIYNSDQTANRTGIESNIADEYGITLP